MMRIFGRLCVQDAASPAHSARGTCPESPGSYVARMQRALLRIERSGSNANGNIIVNGKLNRNVNGTTNGNTNGTTNSNINGQGNSHDCVGTGATVGLEGSATGGIGTHAAESTEQGTRESHQRGFDEDPQGYHEMDLMIAAVSTMIGMHVPEEARYVLWVVCCAVIVLIPGRRWGLFEPSLWSASSSPPPPAPPLVVVVATEGDSGSVAPSHGNASTIHREGGGAARVESHDSQHWHHPAGKASDGTAGQHVAAGGAEAGEAVKGAATAAPEEQAAPQYDSTKLYQEVSSPCSKDHICTHIHICSNISTIVSGYMSI